MLSVRKSWSRVDRCGAVRPASWIVPALGEADDYFLTETHIIRYNYFLVHQYHISGSREPQNARKTFPQSMSDREWRAGGNIFLGKRHPE